jgi:serralysin
MTAVKTAGTSTAVFDVWLAKKQWANATLTYSFPTDGSTYNYMSTGSVTPLSVSQQNAVRDVLAEIASFTGLSFTKVIESTVTEGDLRFATDASESGAYAYLPSAGESGGDAFFGPVTDNPNIGNESYLYFSHEIGHTMGLNHGHEYKSFRNSGLDSQEFTVVTYTDYVGDTTSSFDAGPIDWAQSYMQLDIAAMQFLYGANYAFAGEIWSGDTTYTFDQSTGEMSINGVGQGAPAGNRIFRTIWDGDGTDTYDLSNYSNGVIIDLAAGGWSVFATAQLADLDSLDPGTELARGNVANARLVDGDQRGLIENAVGSQFRDTISGNEADNWLRGNDGDDTLSGGAGADRLRGNQGFDVLNGDDGRDKLGGGSGGDQLFGGNGNDRLNGGKGDDHLFSQDGDDQLNGGKGGDTLTGGLGKDTMTGGAGADTFAFVSVQDSARGKEADVIVDFVSGTDKISLADMSPSPITLALLGSFSGTGPSVLTKLVGSDTRVLVDGDGDGISDFRVDLIGVTSLVTDDFIL